MGDAATSARQLVPLTVLPTASPADNLLLLCQGGKSLLTCADLLVMLSPNVLGDALEVARSDHNRKQEPGGHLELALTADSAEDWLLLLKQVHPILQLQGRHTLTWEEAGRVMLLADKYDIECMKAVCDGTLAASIRAKSFGIPSTAQSTLQWLENSVQLDLPQLQQAITENIEAKLKKAASSSGTYLYTYPYGLPITGLPTRVECRPKEEVFLDDLEACICSALTSAAATCEAEASAGTGPAASLVPAASGSAGPSSSVAAASTPASPPGYSEQVLLILLQTFISSYRSAAASVRSELDRAQAAEARARQYETKYKEVQSALGQACKGGYACPGCLKSFDSSKARDQHMQITGHK